MRASGVLCLCETLQQITQFGTQTVAACRSKRMEFEKSLHDAFNLFARDGRLNRTQVANARNQLSLFAGSQHSGSCCQTFVDQNNDRSNWRSALACRLKGKERSVRSLS